MYPLPRRLAPIPAVLCVAALLLTGCSGDGDGKPEPPARSLSERDHERGNRDDINGDGHADLVVNGSYKAPKTGSRRHINHFIVFAARGDTDPGAAVRLSGDAPAQFTGDLDDDGHADVVVGQRIVWGGPEGPSGTTQLPADVRHATAVGDFDGDHALDLLTLDGDPDLDADMKPQYATVLYGPLKRDGGAPRTTSTFDVGHGGWASIAHAVVGDFDGDGRDDLVTKAYYDEEDVRFEEEDEMPDGVLDATFYRGTAKGLKPTGAVRHHRQEHR
ncbi:VCBS repeat-containing protein [Streptomyces sioyaensis]|uniref:FG-GAP repeat domain-containing protein n=1 Tax=Streptomyces sioyaensis TaxID=67364 RepID=UPI0033E822AE